MLETSVNDRTIEICRRLLARQNMSVSGQAISGAISECVLLGSRIGPNLFDIKNGIAKIVDSQLHGDGGKADIVSGALKAILIIE